MRQISNLMEEHNLKISANNLFKFIKSAIEMREKSKFEFTKNVSDILSEITMLGILSLLEKACASVIYQCLRNFIILLQIIRSDKTNYRN